MKRKGLLTNIISNSTPEPSTPSATLRHDFLRPLPYLAQSRMRDSRTRGKYQLHIAFTFICRTHCDISPLFFLFFSFHLRPSLMSLLPANSTYSPRRSPQSNRPETPTSKPQNTKTKPSHQRTKLTSHKPMRQHHNLLRQSRCTLRELPLPRVARDVVGCVLAISDIRTRCVGVGVAVDVEFPAEEGGGVEWERGLEEGIGVGLLGGESGGLVEEEEEG